MQTAWKKLRLNIIGAAEEALGKRRINKSSKRRTKPWFKEEIKALSAEKRKSYIQYRSGTIVYDSYKITRDRVNEEIKRIKHLVLGKVCNGYGERPVRGSEENMEYNTLRNRRRAVNEYVQITTITTEKWEEYFRNLYGNIHLTPQRTIGALNVIYTPLDSWQISKDSIETTMHKLKNRKSPGPDNIANELLKYGGSALLEELYTLFSKSLTRKETLQDWKESITIPIFKKGEKTNPKNYRGIRLLSTTAKLLTKIILAGISILTV